MKKQSTIVLAEKYGSKISSRKSIEIIADVCLDKVNTFTLDFEGIDFISRSAAHQVNVELERLIELNVFAECKNMTSDVEHMLYITRRGRVKDKVVHTVEKVVISSSVEESELFNSI